MAEQQKKQWSQSPRDLLRTVLMLEDSPHSIALGTAIGIFIGLTPTVGVQMILVMIVALLTSRLFYFNRVAALIAVYISNPITMVPLYYGLYWLGTLFVGGDTSESQFRELLVYNSFAEWWDTIVALFVSIGTPLLIGTAIVAPIGGLLTYPAMYWLVKRFRLTHPDAETISEKELMADNSVTPISPPSPEEGLERKKA